MVEQNHSLSGILLFLFIFFLTSSSYVLAQASDLVLPGDVAAPVIEHDVSTQPAQTGEPLIIEADVSDVAGVEEVILFYRQRGDAEFKRLPMLRSGGTRYQATIPAQAVTEAGVEYYLQATDNTGNTVLRGIAFSPLQVKVKSGTVAESVAEASITPARPSSPPKEKKKSKTMLWVIGGAVLVGAAVALGAGGGGSGGEAPGVTTGNVIINGNTP